MAVVYEQILALDSICACDLSRGHGCCSYRDGKKLPIMGYWMGAGGPEWYGNSNVPIAHQPIAVPLLVVADPK